MSPILTAEASGEVLTPVAHRSRTVAETAEVWSQLIATLAVRKARPAWLLDKCRQLDSLLDLQANWNSYGARPIDRLSVVYSKLLVDELARVEGIEAPTVSASADGNAALCWDDGKRSVDVEVLPDGRMAYVYLNEAEPERDDEGITSDAERLAIILTQW